MEMFMHKSHMFLDIHELLDKHKKFNMHKTDYWDMI